jgi:hypothetical protein
MAIVETDLRTVGLETAKVVLVLCPPLRKMVLNSQRTGLVDPSTTIGFAEIVNGVHVVQTMGSVVVMKRIVELAYAVRLLDHYLITSTC